LVADLVERFSRDRKVFLSPDYKEEQLRAEFLNPFFESLGWDVDDGNKGPDVLHIQRCVVFGVVQRRMGG
jgi:hypothetical protein